ncbi:MAG: hypothetical protein ACI8PZ_004674 [Myxococcota bacterium]|jgi:hypothetical protein
MIIGVWVLVGAALAGDVESTCRCTVFTERCVEEPIETELDPRRLAVQVEDAELLDELAPVLLDELRGLAVGGRPLFAEVLVDQEVSRWIRFHRDRARQLHHYRRVREVRLGEEADAELADVLRRERYDACVADEYANRLHDLDSGARDLLVVRRGADGWVVLARAESPALRVGEDSSAGEVRFRLAAWRGGDPGVVRRKLLSLYPVANAAPELTVSVRQASVNGGGPRPCSDEALAVLSDEPLHLDVGIRDEEAPDALTIGWSVAGQDIMAAGRGIVAFVVDPESLASMGAAESRVDVEVFDASGDSVTAACAIRPVPRTSLRPIHAPLQIVGGVPTMGVLGGRARIWPSPLGREQLLHPLQLRVDAGDAAQATSLRWTQTSGPPLRCDAVRAVECTQGAQLEARTDDPLLVLSSTQPGSYTFDVSGVVDGQRTQVTSTEVEARYHSATVASGLQPEIFGGYRNLRGASLPFVGGSFRALPGLHLRGLVAPVVDLLNAEVELEPQSMGFGFGVELDVADALATLIDRPQERWSPRAAASLWSWLDVDLALIADLGFLLAPTNPTAVQPKRVPPFALLQVGPHIRMGSVALLPYFMVRPEVFGGDPRGDGRQDLADQVAPGIGWGLQASYRFRTSNSGMSDGRRAQTSAHWEFLAQQSGFHCWRTMVQPGSKAAHLRCRARADDLHPLRAVAYWAAPERSRLSRVHVTGRTAPGQYRLRLSRPTGGRWLGSKSELEHVDQAAVRRRLVQELKALYPRMEDVHEERQRPDGLACDGACIWVWTENARTVVVGFEGEFLNSEQQRWCSDRRYEPGEDPAVRKVLRAALCDQRLDRTLVEMLLDVHSDSILAAVVEEP